MHRVFKFLGCFAKLLKASGGLSYTSVCPKPTTRFSLDGFS